MTKKDYELIAKIFNKNINDTTDYMTQVKYTGNQISKSMAMQFADVLKTNNPKFDTSKFLTACGIETKPFNPDDSIYRVKHAL